MAPHQMNATQSCSGIEDDEGSLVYQSIVRNCQTGNAADDQDDVEHGGDLTSEEEEAQARELASSNHRGSSLLCSYIKSADFVELVVCLVFRLLTNIIFLYDEYPRKRPIPVQYLQETGQYVRNLMFNEEFHPSSLSPFMHSVLSYYLPPLIQVALAFFFLPKCLARRHMHATACVYIVAFGLTNLATEALKLYVGYQRPFFFDHCQPDDDYSTCTDEHQATSARKSFPSGHASMSFCGLLLLTLYIEQFWGVTSVRRPDTTTTPPPQKRTQLYRARLVSMLSLLPLAVAAMFAASRIVDNKHFPADVVAGSLLGSGLAYFAHFLWF